MAVVVIIGLLAVFLTTQVIPQGEFAKQKIAKACLAMLDGKIGLFRLQHGRIPDSLDDLVVQPSWVKDEDWPEDGYLETLPADPWGNDYIIRKPGIDGRRYNLICLGADGAEGGEGRDADLIHPERVARR